MREYPALIISNNLVPLYRNFGKQGLVVNVVTNVPELREFMSKFTGIISDKPIILSDLARIGIYQSRILKFIEENPSPIVCISSEDCVTSVLLSRFITVVKYPQIVENEGDKPSFIVDKLSDTEDSFNKEDVLKHAPSVFYQWEMIKKARLPSRDKIMQLVFS